MGIKSLNNEHKVRVLSISNAILILHKKLKPDTLCILKMLAATLFSLPPDFTGKTRNLSKQMLN